MCVHAPRIPCSLVQGQMRMMVMRGDDQTWNSMRYITFHDDSFVYETNDKTLLAEAAFSED